MHDLFSSDYRFHKFEIVCLEPKKDIVLVLVDILDKFGLTLVGCPNITNRMYLYCSQMTPEYSDVTERLEENQYIFSDIYEFNCWRCQKFSLNIILTVPGVVGSNTVLNVKTLYGTATGEMKTGGVDVVEGVSTSKYEFFNFISNNLFPEDNIIQQSIQCLIYLPFDRLNKLDPRAATFRVPPVKVYANFETVIGLKTTLSVIFIAQF